MKLSGLVALCLLSQANAQAPDTFVPEPPAVSEAPTVSTEEAPVLTETVAEHAAETGDDERKAVPVCSLNVPDMELAKIVRILADQTRTNIVLMSKPDSRLTLRLQDVPLRTMLRHICALSGLAMLEVDDTFVIATEEQLKTGYPTEWAIAHPAKGEVKQEQRTETIQLKYVRASQMANALSTLYPKELLTIVVGPDQKSPSIEDQKIKVTGNETTALGSNTVGVQTGGVAPESTSRTIMLRGPKDVMESALEAIQKFDVARPQVSIAVTVHEVTNEAVKELGLGWSFSNIVVRDRRLSNSGGSGSSTNDRGGAFDPLSATATVKALETASKARLLASPTVSVLDGERGYVLIGDRIKYPVVTTFSQANTPIFDVREDRVGIYLQVAANIAPDNQITLSLYPQVSTITGFLNVNGASYPQISTREAQTTIRLKSGETIFMAGLLRDDQVERTDKVPILGDIPILGELFKLRKKTKTGSQLVISITPIILEGKSP